MDAIKQQYHELTQKLQDALPLNVYPTLELTQVFRKDGATVTLKTKLTITDVHNSGDISGIMCVVRANMDDGTGGITIACSLTHLVFTKECPLHHEVWKYQKKRVKRVNRLQRRGYGKPVFAPIAIGYLYSGKNLVGS